MSVIILKIIYFFECFIHGLFFPILFIFQIFSPKLRARFKEELAFNKPFSSQESDICFEVSSEGELEQIAAILTRMLESNLKIQLVIGSESLANKARNLQQKNTNLEVRMVPLVSYFWVNSPLTSNLRSLIKSRQLILCRYDFFPELMLKGISKSHRFILLSASIKNKKLAGVTKWYWKSVFQLFDAIIPASEIERNGIQNLINKNILESFDFRQIRIFERLNKKEDVLSSWIAFKALLDKLSYYPKNKRLIIGSCWEQELEIFKDKNLVNEVNNGSLVIAIAPHKLNKNYLQSLSTAFNSLGTNLELISVDDHFPQQLDDLKGKVLLLTRPGILVELYSLFGHAFVGGGYGRSIHSVLEPFLANCQVYCGPKTHRSTEFDLILKKSPDKVHVVNPAASFYTILADNLELQLEADSENGEWEKKVLHQFDGHYKNILEGKYSTNA